MSDQANKKVYNLVILDESGSMNAIKPAIIGGFNELVQTIQAGQRNFPEQRHFVTLVTFNGTGVRTLLDRQPVDTLPELSASNYRPDSLTPLYDAMGFSLKALEEATSGETDAWHLVTVLTDGAENASKEYTGQHVSRLVGTLGEGNWTFTYIGANHDVMAEASKMNITNVLDFEATDRGSHAMWTTEQMQRMQFYRKMSDKTADLKSDYYGKPKSDPDRGPDRS